MGFFQKLAINGEKSRAEAGSNIDQFRLAERYYKGDGLEQNYELAFKWYVQAARRKYVYRDGKGISYDIPQAKYMVGMCYKNGVGIKQNEEVALKILKHLLEWLSSNSTKWNIQPPDDLLPKTEKEVNELELKYLYSSESGKILKQHLDSYANNNLENAWAYLQKAAEMGNEDALLRMAQVYNGLGSSVGKNLVEENGDAVIEWLEKAVALGSVKAMMELYRALSSKFLYKSCRKEPEKALRFLKKAVDSGSAEAIVELGKLYERGSEIVNRNLTLAKTILLPIAQQKPSIENNRYIRDAKRYLGFCYANERNYEEAINWYKKCLELPEDDPFVCFDSNICESIGLLYLEELHNKYEAIEWLQKGIDYDNNVNCRSAIESIRY